MLHTLNNFFPVRYTAFFLCVLGLLLSGFTMLVFGVGGGWALVFTGLVAGGVRPAPDQTLGPAQLPIIGHIRFMLEYVRPEIRQYFIESDNEATPFSRSQRSLVYQRAKGDPDKRPFGTQLDVHAEGYEWINHSMAPTRLASHDFRITIGPDVRPALQPCQRVQHFGHELWRAQRQRHPGAERRAPSAAALRTTRAKAPSPPPPRARRRPDLGSGSGYFGCRNDDGSFNADKFAANARDPQVKMIELKLSQGAKPGHGGVLPGPKVTPEIAAGPRRAGGRGLRVARIAQRVFHTRSR
jgi:glutamate synthase domain-containing protein 2